MSIRRILFIPLLLSLLLFLYFSPTILNDFRYLLEYRVADKGLFLVLILLAVVLQFTGHSIRALKAKYLMSPASETSFGSQLRALSIGYLFNTILPFRLGELIRAQVVAATQSLSYGFSLSVIIIERLVDGIILSVLGLILVAIGILPIGFAMYLSIALVVAIVVAIFIFGVIHENSAIQRCVYDTSMLFNKRLKTKIQFKYWSVFHGLKLATDPKRVARYILLSISMWSIYFLSLAVFLVGLNPQIVTINSLVAPFYAISVPLGPASLGTFSHIYESLAGDISGISMKVAALSSWVILIIPMGVVGLLCFMNIRLPIWRKFDPDADESAYMNKLSRDSDISGELSLFLDNYLKGNSLSNIVNRLEYSGNFRLLRYFKGGSDAITVLVSRDKSVFVEKIITIELKDRLKAQYDWLKGNKDKAIVKVHGEETGTDYYSIKLKYDKNNLMFFDYMHGASLEESIDVIDQVWEALGRTVHKRVSKRSDVHDVRDYIEKHFYQCLEKSIAVSDDLKNVTHAENICINGKRVKNVYKIMELITANKKIMKDLSTYASSGAVHGDVAVDNILVDPASKKITLIDPAPDGNIINGRVFDFGKNMQSLYCGYEFLIRLEEPAVLHENGDVEYKDQKSHRYVQLCDYVRDELAPKYLTDAEQKAMIFHAGVLMIRRLKHQVYQDPRLTLAIYGAGVKALNDFYDLYDR